MINNSNNEALYMSVEEAKIRYGIKTTKIYEMMNAPDSPDTYKFGKKRLLPVKEYDEYFRSQLSIARKKEAC